MTVRSDRSQPAYDLFTVRSALPVLKEVTYLNTGTEGIMAEPVLEKHLSAQADFERGGHYTHARAIDAYEAARSAIARFIGAEPDEITLTRNATDGVALVAAGLHLTSDDRVITTSEEHPAVILPWAVAERRGGAKFDVFKVSQDPEETLAALDRVIDDNTRLVVASQVSCETGFRLPIKEICAYCSERGILTLIDGAQSVGQFTVNVRDLGCDFMTGNGHKWLAGPKGTGFLYTRAGLIDQIDPVLVGSGSTSPNFDRVTWGDHPASAEWSFEPTGRRFEYGTRNWHTFAALPAAIDYQASLGWDSIWQHVDRTSSYLKQRLEELPGAKLHTPMDWSSSSGLVTFVYQGWGGVELSRALWDRYGIIQRRVQVPDAMRVSCAYFTSAEDIDRLIQALGELRRG